MARTLLNARIRRRAVAIRSPYSPLVRQWQLLEWLSSQSEGITVRQAAEAMGVDLKSIRRDLVVLRAVGFDLEETVGFRGLKSWRVRQPFERLRSKKRRYETMRDTLDLLLEQAKQADDLRLLADLEAIRQRIDAKCR